MIMNALYLKDCYMKEFEAVVEDIIDDRFIILDQTAFYPNAGGQPHDLGVLIKDNSEYPVVYVRKMGDLISHEIADPGLAVGDHVTGRIDWERRYLFMRSHAMC